jgi:hypothetical protein
MDTEATKNYYSALGRDHVCSCDYCQNLIDEIKGAYPKVAEYLAGIGVDIERPFEVFLPIEYDDGHMDYYAVQYLVAGDPDGFEDTVIDDISIGITDQHPEAKYKGKHFIIEAGTFHIKCRYDKYKFN